jgi:SAM-dependent methyltransferase
MSDWQERITQDTAPAIRAEHELRYRIAAPLIVTSGTWADLGCGNGLAAAAALDARRPRRMVLIDLEPETVAEAARQLEAPPDSGLAADLTDPSDLERIAEMLGSREEQTVVTCFEVLEHLAAFVPLIEWTKELARDRTATVLLSVPNDAFWSIENPHHQTSWGERAFEELRQLLPSDHTLLRQVALAGSAIVDWSATPERRALDVETGGEGTVATHFLAAFGSRHGEVAASAMAVQANMLGQRHWERERESNLATAQETVVRQRAELDAHEATIIKLRQDFVAWRAYIHELERELGRPLSGVSDAEAQANGEAEAQPVTRKLAEPPA